MNKALVTGGAGFIGSHLVDALCEKQWDVVVVDDLSVGLRDNVNSKARLQVLNIADAKLHDLFLAEKPDVVFHLAAQKSVTVSVREPIADAQTNILGSLNVLQACVASGVKKVVFSSTGGAIYDEHGTLPASEENRELPLSPYGIGKLAIDHYLRFYKACYGLSSVSLRYANVYGPRQDPHGEAGVVAIFFSKLLSGSSPIINGDGKQTRDFVYVQDVVDANLRAAEGGQEGIFNIGTGAEISVNELFRRIVSVGSFQAQESHGPAKDGEMLRSALDASKARERLQWKPNHSFDEGLQETYSWFREKVQ